jgi:DNA-binding response OmpR family regulator
MPTVLVVEDDPDLRHFLELMLEEAGYDVCTARDGREALGALDRHAPCLILLDLMMPIMDGRRFREEQLRGRAGRVPIVVVSARHDCTQIAQTIGAAGCVPKPFDMNVLLAIVQRLCPTHSS